MRSKTTSPRAAADEAVDLGSKEILEIEESGSDSLPTLLATVNNTFGQAKLEQSDRLD